MTPYDVMLSESQERMLVVVAARPRGRGRSVFEAWDLTSAVIGEVTDDGLLTVVDGRDEVATCRRAVDRRRSDAPAPGVAPAPRPGSTWTTMPPLVDPAPLCCGSLATPNLSSRRGIFRRYDHMVGDSTVIRTWRRRGNAPDQGHARSGSP